MHPTLWAGEILYYSNDYISDDSSDAGSKIALRALFESVTDEFFFLGGPDATILAYNHSAYKFGRAKFGKKMKRGDLMTCYLTPAFHEAFMKHYRDALVGKRSKTERLGDYGSKGKIWWKCIFEPVNDLDGNIIGVSYTACNINDRKLFEQRILDQNKSLLDIAKIQSHEYRGPVATIIGLMNLIKEDGYVASKEYLEMLEVAVNQLDDKIRSVVNSINHSEFI